MKMSKALYAEFKAEFSGPEFANDTTDTAVRRWNTLYSSDQWWSLVKAAYAEGLTDNHIDTALRRIFS